MLSSTDTKPMSGDATEKTMVDEVAESVCQGDETGGSPRIPTTTQRGLRSRHAQMIALGGTIGTALFVGSGQALRMGGPLFVFLSYLLITIMLYGVVTATGEMSAYLPLPGSSVAYYAHRYVSHSLSFALGWIYWYTFVITTVAEITAATLVLSYWHNPVPTAVWISIIGIVIIVCNSLPVRVYGETEFWFASTKVIGILGLLSLTVVLFFGGGPKHDALYFGFWSNPGPVNEYLVPGAAGRLCAFVGTLVFSVFAFTFAPELLVVTSGEMDSPRRNVPTATRRYFYRLVLFYCLGALAIGILVPSNNPRLLSASGSTAAASPWAIGIHDAGIRGLDSVVNAMILLSAWSCGNSYLYLSSRALYSLAVAGNAPAIFKRCTSSGVPYYATALSAAFCALAYLNVSQSSAVVFNWLVNINVTSGFESWICCCFIYVRFRKALDAQGIHDVPFRSRFQPYFAWISGGFFFAALLLSGFRVFVKGYWNTSTFFTSYVGVLVFAVLYFGHRFTVGRNDKWMLRSQEIDLQSGLDQILALEDAPKVDGTTGKWYQKWKLLYE